MEFELFVYPESGEVEMYYEDRLHGDDTLIRVKPDGLWLRGWDAELKDDNGNPLETLTLITDPHKFFTELEKRYDDALKAYRRQHPRY